MFTCKQISDTLSKEDYEKLSPMRKCLLKLHVRFCFICGKFNSQVMETQDMCRCYKEREEELEACRPKMNHSRKEALRRLLASQAEEHRGG